MAHDVDRLWRTAQRWTENVKRAVAFYHWWEGSEQEEFTKKELRRALKNEQAAWKRHRHASSPH